MSNLTIHTTFELLVMPPGAPIPPYLPILNASVNRYWRGAEKPFLIELWRAEKLLEASNLNQVALKVTNIEAPNIVNGEWVSLNAESDFGVNINNESEKLNSLGLKITKFMSNALKPLYTETYFAFGKSVLDDLKTGLTHQNGIIIARLGEKVSREKEIFFLRGTFDIDGTGVGGGGTASGARIPNT